MKATDTRRGALYITGWILYEFAEQVFGNFLPSLRDSVAFSSALKVPEPPGANFPKGGGVEEVKIVKVCTANGNLLSKLTGCNPMSAYSLNLVTSRIKQKMPKRFTSFPPTHKKEPVAKYTPSLSLSSTQRYIYLHHLNSPLLPAETNLVPTAFKVQAMSFLLISMCYRLTVFSVYRLVN